MSKLYDLLQSVINKVKNTEKSLESVPKTVNGVEPDENGNVAVSSSWNDIAYKPFSRSAVTVLEDALISGFEISDGEHEHVSGDVFVCHNPNIKLNLLAEMPIIEAQWDGTIYEVAYENQVIGNEYLVNPDAKDNGLPFLIVNSRYGVDIYTTDSGTEHAISMYVDGVMIEDSPFMKVKNYFEFWISYDEENDVYSADKTYYDILDAYESGKTITVYLNGIGNPYTTPVITKLEDGTIFLGNFDFTIAIYPDDYVEYYENAFVTYEDVFGMIDEALGVIENGTY